MLNTFCGFIDDISVSNEFMDFTRIDLGIIHVGETKERTVVILHRSESDRREPVLRVYRN